MPNYKEITEQEALELYPYCPVKCSGRQSVNASLGLAHIATHGVTLWEGLAHWVRGKGWVFVVEVE